MTTRFCWWMSGLRQVSMRFCPGGRYITAYHVGHWMNIGQTYERLLQYKEQHHLKTESFYIERYVVDNFIAKEIEDYVTEVAVRILDASDR